MLILLRRLSSAPRLQVRPPDALRKGWWALTPFHTNTLEVPVFQARDGTYAQTTLLLDPSIFNVPIRRDLIYRLMHWARNREVVSTKTTLTKGTVSGAGEKPRPQKKTGQTRIGNKRAPQRWKGGKAHGPQPTIYSFHLNDKVKLKALKALLSSKLAEGRIRVVTDFTLEQAKTKPLTSYSFSKESRTGQRVLLLKPEVEQALTRSASNLTHLVVQSVYDLDIMLLLKTDRVYITQAGVRQLQDSINGTHQQFYQQRHQKSTAPAQPHNPFANEVAELPFFGEYKELLAKAEKEQPDRLAREIRKTVRRPVP